MGHLKIMGDTPVDEDVAMVVLDDMGHAAVFVGKGGYWCDNFTIVHNCF